MRLAIVAPGYLPEMARPILPWARRHVARVARRYHTGESDLWDETIMALLRAAVYFDPEPPPGTGAGRDGSAYSPAKAFGAYARLAVNRACWRYVCRGLTTRDHPWLIPIHTERAGNPLQDYHRRARHEPDSYALDEDLGHAMASSEEEVMARETVWLRSSPIAPQSARRVAK